VTHSLFQPAPRSRGEGASGPGAEDRVRTTVLQAVATDRLHPGDRIVERELSQATRANRMAIRNALLRLADAGLVTLSRNKGARLAALTPHQASEIFDTRVVIERWVIETLAASFSDKVHDQLQSILRDEASASDAGQTGLARRCVRRFHMRLGQLAGNSQMSRFLNDLVEKQPLLSPAPAGRMSDHLANTLHIKTLGALQRGQTAKAVAHNTRLLRTWQREALADTQAPDPAPGAG